MRILFLNKRVLYPTNTGSRNRTLNVLKYLARWHDVTYLCNVRDVKQEPLEEMRELGVRMETVPWHETPSRSLPYYRDVTTNLASQFPFTVNEDYDLQLRSRAARLLENERYELLICNSVQMARNAIGLSGPPKILFQHNVEAEITRWQSEHDRGWLRRRYMWIQWRKMKDFEAEAGRHFDGVITESERNLRLFQSRYGWRHVHAIDTSVDVTSFQPGSVANHEQRVVFVGSMDCLPNEDGVRFFVERVWPRIRATYPNAVFDVVGRNPSRQVQQLGEQPGVRIIGTVPDVRPYLAAATVVVVPVLVGGGTPIRIFEAMAAGKAIVSTTLGAEGLPIRNEEHLLLANWSDEFAGAVIRLLGEPDTRTRLATAARELVVTRFCAETVATEFSRICEHVVQDASRQPAGRAQEHSPIEAE